MIDIASKELRFNIRKSWYQVVCEVLSRKGRGLRELCRLLGYTPQAYYSHGQMTITQHLREDVLLCEVMQHRLRQPHLGARKLLVKLEGFMAAHGISLGRDAFFELLRSNGLLVRRHRRNKPLTTFSLHSFRKYDNLVQGWGPDHPELLWVSDITYIPTGSSFTYLSMITDAYSRKIVGYHLGENLQAEGPQAALEMAIKSRQTINRPLIHHSDRGVQYCSLAYTRLLGANSIRISMTQSGNPRENAIAERVNGILKQELLNGHYNEISSARQDIAAAIEIYNNERPHASLDMLTPQQAHECSGIIKRKWKNYYLA